MSNFKMALLAIAAPVGACVTRGYHPEPAVPVGYNFSYETVKGDEVGLIQAFDDGEHTYLQFRASLPRLDIRAGAGGPALAYRLNDRYVTVDGVYSRLLVTADHNSASIRNETREEPPPLAGEPWKVPGSAAIAQVSEPPAVERSIAEIGVPESLQSMHANLRVTELNREIAQLEERVRLLSAQLDEAHRAGAADNLSVRSEFPVPRIVVHFEDNSADAILNDDMLGSLGAAARSANRIYLHGHTDAYTASDAGTDLAIRRTVAVRELLIAQQVAPSRVRLFYRGAGSFVANNSTPEGKAQNRRVEIELRKW